MISKNVSIRSAFEGAGREMEGILSHKFRGNEEQNMISIKKEDIGTRIIVINPSFGHFCKALVNGEEQIVPKKCVKLDPCPDFKGVMESKDAEIALKSSPENSCLISFVYSKETKTSNYVLSMKNNLMKVKIQHILIQRKESKFYFRNHWFDSINKLVNILFFPVAGGLSQLKELNRNNGITQTRPIETTGEIQHKESVSQNNSGPTEGETSVDDTMETEDRLDSFYRNVGYIGKKFNALKDKLDKKYRYNPTNVKKEIEDTIRTLSNLIDNINNLGIGKNTRMSNKRDKALSSAETSIQLLKTLITKNQMNNKVIVESDEEDFSGPFNSPLDNALAKQFPGAFKAKVDKTKPANRTMVKKSNCVSKKKGTETEFMEYDSDDPDCPMCASTIYRCEKCGRKCCSPCANYDGEDPARGHGDYRNHPIGNPNCK